ncbi:MAG: UDP-N-acetylmuramoyl-tripeptide--D-alanyl-D-alanine ligase [bacterium]|nr:UDP-N-acetylmuramoyl-tripeptide--D-alanyl-D-alanine ligase [bacterium]
MKEVFKKIIVYIITLEAKLVLKKYKPEIVAVTGSVGKTSSKEAIATVLETEFSVRKNIKSFNSEIGAPLTVLGCDNAWYNPVLWIFNIIQGLKLLLFKVEYPRWLVLELGVERPGDMSRLMSWIKPRVSVITAFSDTPSHVEYFSGSEGVIKEKLKILKNLQSEDCAILNGDNVLLSELKEKTNAQIVTYGFSEGTDFTASNYHILLKEEDGKTLPEGITFKIDYKGSSIPVRIFNTFGKHNVYPALAAVATGVTTGLNLLNVSEALSKYESPSGRLKLLEGVKNSFILDDTYNSSPPAAMAALEVLGDLSAKRKIAVLGDMLELGKYTIEAHRALGERALRSANIVFTVGPRAKFIAESLRENGFDKENIFEFSTSNEAKMKVQEIIEEGDLVLVKGSQGMRMERIVEEIMAHPEQKQNLLVRQDKMWKSIK